MRWRSFTTMIARETAILIARCAVEIAQQSGEGQRRINDDRAHVGHVLKVRVDIACVKDAEIFLADLITAPRRSTYNLIIQDAAVKASSEQG